MAPIVSQCNHYNLDVAPDAQIGEDAACNINLISPKYAQVNHLYTQSPVLGSDGADEGNPVVLSQPISCTRTTSLSSVMVQVRRPSPRLRLEPGVPQSPKAQPAISGMTGNRVREVGHHLRPHLGACDERSRRGCAILSNYYDIRWPQAGDRWQVTQFWPLT